MSDLTQHIKYTVADIEKYLQGKMTNAERNTFEKAALADPFLADAIEGFENANWSKAKNMLHQTEAFIKSSAQQHYNLTDIEKYLQGTMTNAERNTFEKAALADPFLADAIEGFENADLNKAKKYIDENVTAIKGKKAEKAKVVAMPLYKKQWLRVAAAIVLMVGVGSSVWIMNNQSDEINNNNIANVVKEEIIQTPNNNSIVSSEESNTKNKTAKNNNKKSSIKSTDITSLKSIETNLEPNAAFKNSEASAGIFSTEAAKVNTESTAINSTVGEPPSYPSIAVENKDKDQLIQVKKEEALLKSKKAVENAKYNNASKTLIKGNTSMDSTNILNNPNTTPIGGWQKFNDYINTQTTLLNDKAIKTDSVVVNFQIDENGKPFQIKAQSHSSEKSARAVELIKNGVNWKVIDAKSNKVVIFLKF